jgi:hypothetical protein
MALVIVTIRLRVSKKARWMLRAGVVSRCVGGVRLFGRFRGERGVVDQWRAGVGGHLGVLERVRNGLPVETGCLRGHLNERARSRLIRRPVGGSVRARCIRGNM